MLSKHYLHRDFAATGIVPESNFGDECVFCGINPDVKFEIYAPKGQFRHIPPKFSCCYDCLQTIEELRLEVVTKTTISYGTCVICDGLYPVLEEQGPGHLDEVCYKCVDRQRPELIGTAQHYTYKCVVCGEKNSINKLSRNAFYADFTHVESCKNCKSSSLCVYSAAFSDSEGEDTYIELYLSYIGKDGYNAKVVHYKNDSRNSTRTTPFQASCKKKVDALFSAFTFITERYGDYIRNNEQWQGPWIDAHRHFDSAD